MNKVIIVLLALAAAVFAAGCESDVEESGKKSLGKSGYKVLSCYHYKDLGETVNEPCWVEFTDGMICLRSSGHGYTFGPCYGGKAAEYERRFAELAHPPVTPASTDPGFDH